VDVTPPEMWGTLWELDAAGTTEMPGEVYLGGRRTQFWKGYWFKFSPGQPQPNLKTANAPNTKHNAFNRQTRPKRLPARFWQTYWTLFPQGHKEDSTDRVHPASGRAWDDRKHGYWRVNGRLQYRSPDGKIHTDVDGADKW